MNIAWIDLWRALALVLVIEGLLPFLSPRVTRQTLATAAQMPDRVLRGAGLLSMLAGVAVLYLVN